MKGKGRGLFGRVFGSPLAVLKGIDKRKRSALQFALAFPLFFMIMFPLAYVTALHKPSLHDFPVGIVGPPSVTAPAIHQLSASTGDMFDFSAVATKQQARQEIYDQTIKAAYVPGQNPTLLEAGAEGRLASQYTSQTFTKLASAQGHQLAVKDIAPLAPGDGTGIGLLFYMLIPTLIGFVSANILGLATGWFLSTRVRLAILAGLAVLAAVIPWALMGPWLNILRGTPGQLAAVLGLTALVSFTVALITTSLVEIMGRWAIFVAITVFVFLNIPSSGAVYPVAAVPPFFGLLNQFHIGAALVDGLRAILYFHGNGIVEAVVTILAWTLAGLVLLALALAKKYRQQQATEESRQQGVEQQPEGSPETAS